MTRLMSLACALMLAGVGLAVPALAETAQPGAVASLQPTEAEEKIYYDLSMEGLKAVSTVQRVWMEEMQSGRRDPEKLCRLTGDMYRLHAGSVQAQMDYLLGLRAGLKSIDTLTRSWLGSSYSMDDARIRELETCAEAEAKARGLDDAQEMDLFIGRIEQDLVRVDRAYADAKAAGNPLGEAGHIQTQEAYLKEMIENGEIVRDYGDGDNKAVVSKIPAWEARRKALAPLMAEKVYVYTDPDNARSKPYVFTPFVVPPMPADDDAFDRAVSGMMSAAVSPMLEALRTLLTGDSAAACVHLRNSDSELQRLRVFVTAYIDAQAAKGTPTDRGAVVLPKVDEMIAKVRSTIALRCAVAL